jgi:hypothetical protein
VGLYFYDKRVASPFPSMHFAHKVLAVGIIKKVLHCIVTMESWKLIIGKGLDIQ